MRIAQDQPVLPGGPIAGRREPGSPRPGASRHRGHGWMMIACCLPMLVIAGILVAIGAASPVFLASAVGCTLLMAAMMRGMGHGGDDDHR